VSPRDMVWTRGKRKEILSYYISEFLVGEGGLLDNFCLRDFIEETSIDGSVFS